jgi:hypothetical protein
MHTEIEMPLRLTAAENYATFFRDQFPEKEAALLKAHALGGEMSMGELAPVAGYDTYSPVNATYGRIGRRLAEAFDLKPPLRTDGSPIRFAVLAAWREDALVPEREDDQVSSGAASFRSYLHEEVIRGLHLGGVLSKADLNTALDKRAAILADIQLRKEHLIGKRVYVANFGEKNYAWPECLKRNAIATMNPIAAQPFWEAGDKEGYVAIRSRETTAAGNAPTSAILTRWFNLMTRVAESEGDLWFHRDGDVLWWTVTTEEPPVYEALSEPVGRKRDVIICYKPCRPWSRVTKTGNALLWSGLHAKARDFFFTESTLIQLKADKAAYARALLNGDDLAPWHDREDWKAKAARTGASPLNPLSALDKSVADMATTAKYTTERANGQREERLVKNKNLKLSDRELEDTIRLLIEDQGGNCNLSGLPLQFLGTHQDDQMLASLDRIDSDGHYEAGNLQVVCRFINKWKSNTKNDEFRRLMAKVQGLDEE